MAKKRRASKRGAEAPVEITPALLEEGRTLIEKLPSDLHFNQAKQYFRRNLHLAEGEANALVVALRGEGCRTDEHARCFVSSSAQSFRAIVKGARSLEQMTVVREDDPETGWPLEELTQEALLPGDVLALRPMLRYGDTPRMVAVLERTRRRWIVRRANAVGNLWAPVNQFAPVLFELDPQTLPETLDPGTVIEIEVEDVGETLPMHYVFGKFVREIGRKNDPLGEVAIASAEHGIPVEFSEEALAEAEALPDVVPARDMKKRVDLTDIPFVTIDGEDARDFDDAVWCTPVEEGWRLLVAIADVSAYVKAKSALDRDAQARGTSVYFPSSVVPMLPEKLSNGLCSLNPGVDRLTMVCDAVIGADGRTKAYQFYPAVIHSHARLTYTMVWSALEGNAEGISSVEAAGGALDELRHLHALFKVLRAAREKRFALDFETPESQALFADDGTIKGFRIREHNDAHRLIEECMLVANTCAADFVGRRKKETLYRVHPKPEPDRLRTMHATLRALGRTAKTDTVEQLAKLIRETKDQPVMQQTILRAMSRAVYQPENIGHYGLQYEAYAHFTSPIRRYPDLLLHRTIKGILSRRTYVPEVVFDDAAAMEGYHAKKLSEERAAAAASRKASKTSLPAAHAAWARLGVLCSAAERRADDASRDVMQYLKCVFAREAFRTGVFAGRITGMIPAGCFVTLTDMPIDGFVHISNLGRGFYVYDEAAQTMSSDETGHVVKVGQTVEVMLLDVNLNERRINFKLKSRWDNVGGPQRGGRRGSRDGWVLGDDVRYRF